MGHISEILEIIWVDCDVHNPSGIFAILENNIYIQILRFGYRTGSNIPLYAITEERTGLTSFNRLFKINLLIRVRPLT